MKEAVPKTCCTWCGSSEINGLTGYVVMNDLTERWAWTCREQKPTSKHMNNPLFESEGAYEKWRNKHPILGRKTPFQQAIIKS